MVMADPRRIWVRNVVCRGDVSDATFGAAVSATETGVGPEFSGDPTFVGTGADEAVMAR